MARYVRLLADNPIRAMAVVRAIHLAMITPVTPRFNAIAFNLVSGSTIGVQWSIQSAYLAVKARVTGGRSPRDWLAPRDRRLHHNLAGTFHWTNTATFKLRSMDQLITGSSAVECREGMRAGVVASSTRRLPNHLRISPHTGRWNK
jgi:hypothetical protein